MSKTKTEDWHILSDTELVRRARRLTIVGLVIGVVIVGALASLFASSPVQETGGPARAVRIPVAAPPPSDTPATPAAVDPAVPQLPPNPWTRQTKAPPKQAPGQGSGKTYEG